MASIKTFIVPIFVICALVVLTGCSPLKNIAKNELDLVADTGVRTVRDFLTEITLELYHLNPRELKKVAGMDLQARSIQIVEYPVAVAYKELDYQQGVDAIKLSFNPKYSGDRVFALMIGISSMVSISYNNQSDFYLFDQLDPQKLYDSSINLDLVRKKLQSQKAGKQTFVVSDAERPDYIYSLLSKISAVQEMIANLTSDKSGRIVNKALQGVATMFLPIGI